jgi:hypothetical protein
VKDAALATLFVAMIVLLSGCGGLSVSRFGTVRSPPSNVGVFLAVEHDGQPVTDLTADDFTIYEDGLPLGKAARKGAHEVRIEVRSRTHDATGSVETKIVAEGFGPGCEASKPLDFAKMDSIDAPSPAPVAEPQVGVALAPGASSNDRAAAGLAALGRAALVAGAAAGNKRGAPVAGVLAATEELQAASSSAPNGAKNAAAKKSPTAK